jgi:hypothetical protein
MDPRGIGPTEIIDADHSQRAAMIPATAGLNLWHTRPAPLLGM